MRARRQRGSINLWAVSILMMLLTLAGLVFLYTLRYGHLPMQDVWARWGKSAHVISSELKNASGISAIPGSGDGLRPAATVNSGIRKCTIQGKVVFSDTACTDHNPSTKEIKLHDNQGFAPPKVNQSDKEGALQNDANERTNEQLLRLKALDKAIEKSTGN